MMITQAMSTFDRSFGIDRRRMLKAGGALAGTAALLRAAPGHAAEPLTCDVACDGRTMLINR